MWHGNTFDLNIYTLQTKTSFATQPVMATVLISYPKELSNQIGFSGLSATVEAKETLACVKSTGRSGYQLVCEKNVGLHSFKSLQLGETR